MHLKFKKLFLVGLLAIFTGTQGAQRDDNKSWMQAERLQGLGDILSQPQQEFHGQDFYNGVLWGVGASLVLYSLWHAASQTVQGDDFDIDVSPDVPEKKSRAGIGSMVLTQDACKDYLEQALSKFDRYDLDFDLVVAMTSHFTRTKLDRFIKILTKLAVEYHLDGKTLPEKSSDSVTLHPLRMSMVELALDEMCGGSTTYYYQNEQNLMNTAYHEAGHALAIIEQQNCTLHFVSTINRESSCGRNFYKRSRRADYQSLQDCKHEIVICLCGGLTEQLFGFDRAWYKRQGLAYEKYYTRAKMSHELIDLLSRGGVKHDVSHACQIARDMIEGKMITPTHFDQHGKIDMQLEIDYLLEECYQKAVKFLAHRKDDLQKIAKLLLTQDIVCGSAVYALFKL